MSTTTARSPRRRTELPPVLIGVQPMADQLGINHLTLRAMLKRGEVPYYQVGQQYRFDPAEVLDALRGR